jgi:hypothetical protein
MAVEARRGKEAGRLPSPSSSLVASFSFPEDLVELADPPGLRDRVPTEPASSMDCRTFRKQHLTFVDDTLPGVEVVRMQLHLTECPECEAWDQRVRKSLFVARNHLATIEPSAHFRRRLQARLEQERLALVSPPALFGARRRMPVWSLVLGAGAVGAVVITLMQMPSSGSAVLVPVAVIDEAPVVRPPSDGQGASPAYIATMSSGMAILPALMIAEELPALSDVEAPTVRAVGVTMPNPEQREP